MKLFHMEEFNLVDVFNEGENFDLVSPPIGIITNSYKGSGGRVDFKLEGLFRKF